MGVVGEGVMTTRIRAEFWIECRRCNVESIVIVNHPKTGVAPKTKKEAWEAAIASGWGGSPNRPICEYCMMIPRQ